MVFSLYSYFSAFFQLVQFFGGQAGLGHHIPILGEAIVQGIVVANADHIANLIPIIVRIQAVAGQWTLFILQFTIAAGEPEAVFVVDQLTLAHHIEGLGIQQVTFVFCDKGEDFLQAYFFASEEDTEKFYETSRTSLEMDVAVIAKNRYSIYRGTKKAVEDFLS